MGTYLNPENENFTEILKSEIYVDKMMMISTINRFMDTNNKYICVSRPCRFGKTYASNMLFRNCFSGEAVRVNVTKYLNTKR